MSSVITPTQNALDALREAAGRIVVGRPRSASPKVEQPSSSSMMKYIRRRATSFSRPCQPPALGFSLTRDQPPHEERPGHFDGPRPVTSDDVAHSLCISNAEEIVAKIEEASRGRQKVRKVENLPGNAELKRCFDGLSGFPLYDPQEPESSARNAQAHTLLSKWTTMQKLRAVLLGANHKQLRMGEEYESSVKRVEDINLRREMADLGNELSFSEVAKELALDFDLVAQLVDNTVFPVHLIEASNVIVALINSSGLVRYLLQGWRSATTEMVGSTSPNPEVILLECLFACSPAIMMTFCTLLEKDDPTSKLVRRDMSRVLTIGKDDNLRMALGRELEMINRLRMNWSELIDDLFWNRVDRQRPAMEKEEVLKEVERERRMMDPVGWESNRMMRKTPRSGAKRDNKSLRVRVGKRSYLRAAFGEEALLE